MRGFWTVLKYTLHENIRKKTFVISTIIMLILTIAVMIIPGLISKSTGSGTSDTSGNSSSTSQQAQSPATRYFYIVDSLNVLDKDITPLKEAFTDCNIELKTTTDVSSLMDRVKNEDNIFLLVLNGTNDKPVFEYYVKKYGIGPEPDKLGGLLKNIYVSSLLRSAGADTSLTSRILSAPGVNVNELGKGYVKSIVSSMLIMFILFFAIYYFGYGIAMSVASEKTSRVMETLVTSTKPSNIILGKTVAMGLLGLMQLGLILSTAIVTYGLFFPKDFKLFGQSLDFGAFTPLAIIMIVVYFILGYLLYAMFNAVAGASVSKAEDVNSAIMPVSMISLMAFYFSYFPITIPNSDRIATITSIVPLTSPFSMPSRLLMTNVPPLELVISIVLLIATIALFSWVSIKIYSAAILNYGNRLKLSDYIRITKSK